ncbi:MAG: Trm112 family protein [Armatimonadota bacterium]
MTNPPFPLELLELLGCPACADRPPLRWQSEIPVQAATEQTAVNGYLVCEVCHRAYPVREGIPVLLVEEAIPLGAPPENSEVC